jgi:SPT2 chromatin protein
MPERKAQFSRPMPHRKKPTKVIRKSRRDEYDDGEEEEDEELDDFIDDSHLDGKNKAYVRRMYTYDDDEYTDNDDDLRGMDAGFDEIEYEEEISGRIAREEDLIEERINRKFGKGLL